MRHQNSIKGVTFKNNPNMVEHQWFPVEYFSGSDVTIYFGDTFLSECSGLQFGIEERVQPIFGYASHTWDCVARGSRLVTGSFEIPFTEAGYLDTILTHIGQYTSENEKVKPKMAYALSGQKVPSWCADYKMDVEGLFNKNDPGAGGKDTGHKPVTKLVTPGSRSNEVVALKTILDFNIGYRHTPLSQFMLVRYGEVTEEACKQLERDIQYDEQTRESLSKALQETINVIFSLDEKKRFASKESTYTSGDNTITRELVKLRVDGIFDSVSSDAIELILKWFRYTKIKRTTTERYDYGQVTVIDSDLLKFFLGIGDSTIYDIQTYLQAIAYQDKYHMARTGEIAMPRADLPTNDSYGVSADKPKPSYGKDGSLTRWEDRTARYESEIWGRDFTQDTDRKFNTFFYADRYRNAGHNGEKMLKKHGFDIYITYGPAPEAQKYNTYHHEQGINAPALDTYTFQTTVKAIRNVQITSCRQVIGPNGAPISEVYTFMARDLD